MIVHGRGEHQHVGLIERRVDEAHVIGLYAGARVLLVAVLAGEAARDAHAAHVEHGDGVTSRLRPLAVGGDHRCSVSFGTGTPVENDYVHARLPNEPNSG